MTRIKPTARTIARRWMGGAFAAAALTLAGGAQAVTGGASHLGIQITDTSYSLGFDGLASVILSDTTSIGVVRWNEGGDGASGVNWNNTSVAAGIGTGGVIVTTFNVNPGTTIDGAFMNANYNSINGQSFGQWTGGVNVIATAPSVCTLGYPYYAYGCLGGIVNLEGSHAIGPGANPPSNDLLYGFSFTDGAQTAYGWFDIGIAINGALPAAGTANNSTAGSYALAEDPVYLLTLNGYGFSTTQPITAGQLPSGIPEPSVYAMMIAGVGLIGGVARRRRRGRQLSA